MPELSFEPKQVGSRVQALSCHSFFPPHSVPGLLRDLGEENSPLWACLSFLICMMGAIGVDKYTPFCDACFSGNKLLI